MRMLEESKIGEEENNILENKYQLVGKIYEKTKLEFDIQCKETNKGIQILKGEILELQWKNSREKQKGFWKTVLLSFVLTILISFLIIGFFKLPKGTLKNLVDL